MQKDEQKGQTGQAARAERKGSRKRFLDWLRVAATCAVVLLHTVTGVMDTRDMSRYPLEETVFLVLLDLITWCVPVFVMISGYLFLNPERTFTWKDMLWKYCRRIVLALFVFGVPYAMAELWMEQKGFGLAMIGEGIWRVCTGRSWSHLWYLYLILGLYLLTPLLKEALQRMPKGFVYGVLAVLAVGSSVLPFLKKALALNGLPVMPDGWIYLFYYICGYFFAVREKPLGRRARIAAWLAVSALVFGMILSRIRGNYSVQMAYNYPFTILLSLLLMLLAQDTEIMQDTERLRNKEGMQRKGEMQNKEGMQRAGELCFAVYLVHPVFLNLLYKVYDITPLHFTIDGFASVDGTGLPIGVSLPVIYMAVLSAAFVLAFLLRKIPPLRKWVL